MNTRTIFLIIIGLFFIAGGVGAFLFQNIDNKTNDVITQLEPEPEPEPKQKNFKNFDFGLGKFSPGGIKKLGLAGFFKLSN